MSKMQRLTMPFSYAAMCCVAVSLGLTGCGEQIKGVDPNLVKVTGKVTYDGQPLKTGDISFVATDNSGKAYASKIDSSGYYSLAYSESAKGAVPGSYKVRVSATEGGSTTMGAGGEVTKPTNLIPEKYNNPDTSGLTATVEKGKSNSFTFDLKKE